MKRLTYILVIVAMVAAIFPRITHGTARVQLIIDGVELAELDTPPVIISSRVMVPARAVFESVGGSADWDPYSRQITVNYIDSTLIMTVGSTWAWFNGEYIQMEVPPIIINGRTLIPLRFPAETFGFGVDWDPRGPSAIISTSGDIIVPDTPSLDFGTQPSPPASMTATDISSSPIHAAPHSTTHIVDILCPEETGAAAYIIQASSPITYAEHFLLSENRLVIDIHNALSSLEGPFNRYGPVRRVRYSQFSNAPNITRVVFELRDYVEYSVALSYDRKQLIVAFTVNNISEITTTSNSRSDTISIYGDFQPSVRVSSEGYPNYFTVYIDNARMNAPEHYMPAGVLASRFETGQNNGVAYVRVYVRGEWPGISLTHSLNSVSVVLSQGLYGVRYDSRARELRLSRDVVTMNLNEVRHIEEYLENRFTFILPAGANGLGVGTLNVADAYIRSINLRVNSAGNTVILFETTRVMAFTLHVTDDEYIIRANLPQEVYDFIVVIDPGHGGRDPGAVHHGIRESELVLTIAHMVMEFINENPNIRGYMTRHTDVAVANTWRAAFANQFADLYVAIHANAVNNRPNVSGIETWYLRHSREDNLGFTSRQFARIMQRRLINATNAVDRGIKRNSTWIVLRDTQMPAVLLELGFLTNREEAARLASSSHQRRVARAIYEGIVEAFEAYQPDR